MSYCRCTEEGSDVYVYGSGNGWNIHVAYGVGLPLDGKSYSSETPQGCIDILKDLMKEGYGVPQRALDRLAGDVENDSQ